VSQLTGDQSTTQPVNAIAKLVTLASDPKAIQFLLLVLVLDAIGVLDKVLALGAGVCA